jgi:predicted nuclease with RNAse H fold
MQLKDGVVMESCRQYKHMAIVAPVALVATGWWRARETNEALENVPR